MHISPSGNSGSLTLKKIFEKVVLSHWCKLRVPTSPRRCPPCVGTAACIAAEAANKVVLEVGFQPWLQRLELHQRFQGYEPCEIAASPLCHERTLLSPPGIPKRDEERKAEAAEQIRIPYSLLGKVALMKNPPAFLVLL